MKANKDVEGLIKALKKQCEYTLWRAEHDDVGEVGETRAAQALRKIGEAAVEPLIQVLNDKNFHVQLEAIWALGEIGDTRAVDPLIQVLKDEYSGVRETAAEALGKIGDARAVKPLKQALKDENWSVEKAARKALNKIRRRKAKNDRRPTAHNTAKRFANAHLNAFGLGKQPER